MDEPSWDVGRKENRGSSEGNGGHQSSNEARNATRNHTLQFPDRRGLTIDDRGTVAASDAFAWQATPMEVG